MGMPERNGIAVCVKGRTVGGFTGEPTASL